MTASAANGSHRVTAYSAPPSGAPSRPATCWRAWFWLSAVGRSSVGTTVRTADISAGAKTPGGGAGQQRDDQQVRHRERVLDAGDDERGVEQHAAAAGAQRMIRRRSRRSASDAGGQQRRRQAEQVRPPPRRPPASSEPVSAKATSGKTKVLTRLPSSLIV